MARAATTSDVFNAIAEPRRRAIVELLAHAGMRDVSQLVSRLGMSQPAVSKHLSVLRKVGLVSVKKRGSRRVYQLEAGELKTVHDWTGHFETLWTSHLDGIKSAAEKTARADAGK